MYDMKDIYRATRSSQLPCSKPFKQQNPGSLNKLRYSTHIASSYEITYGLAHILSISFLLKEASTR